MATQFFIALDLVFPNETGDWEMEAILRGAGALRAGDVAHSDAPAFNSHSNNHAHTASETHHLQQQQKPKSDVINALLVVASLVATTTFEVALSPPSGIWQDSSDLNNNGTRSSTELAGRSINGSYIFVALNSIGFYVSLYMICILTVTSNFPLQLEIQICVFAMSFTYSTAVANIAPSNNTVHFIVLLTAFFPALLGRPAKWARHPDFYSKYLPRWRW